MNQGPDEHDNKHPNEDLVRKIASSGPIWNSSRIGIMVALLISRRATFTDLLIATGLQKSSLSRSIEILEDNGYIITRYGFLKAGGIRKIIEITQEGEEAIKEYLLLLKQLKNI